MGVNWRPARLDRTKPKYLALVELIEADIAAGDLRDGDRLPPQRDIAKSLDLTIATITKGIREAARRGIVTARTGSGTFVRVGRAPAGSPSTLDLSLNVVPAEPTKRFLDAAFAEFAKRQIADQLCGYESAVGSPAHRRLMADWLALRGLSVEAERILLTHGSQHALLACFQALARSDETILCEQWTYAGIRRLAELNHVRLEGVAMDREGIDPKALAGRLAATGAKIVICSATVQNPTTATMSLARRKKVIAACEAAGAILIEDDIYGHLSGEETPPLAALGRNVVHISSMSKCLASGIRLGTLAAPDALLPKLANALVGLHWTAPVLWASLFETLWRHDAMTKCLEAHRAEARRRMDLYADIIREPLGGALPSYHVWQPLPAAWRLDDLVAELGVEGIRVSPAHHFVVSAPPDTQSHIRVCLGGGDIDQLRQQFVRLRRVMSQPRLGVTIS